MSFSQRADNEQRKGSAGRSLSDVHKLFQDADGLRVAAHGKLDNGEWTGFNVAIHRGVTNSDIQQEENTFSGNIKYQLKHQLIKSSCVP